MFTLDAVMALVVASFLILASFNYISETQAINWNSPNIIKISFNSLAVLELSETLQSAIENSDVSEVEEFLNNLFPEQVCATIGVYDSADSLLLTALKTGCSSSAHPAVNYRSFTVNGNVYYAKMEAWYI